MNYNEIAILLLQGALAAFLILLLFRLRKQIGLGILFTCLGLFQFIQVFLNNTTFVSITDNFIVLPGSTIFFTITLFALLIIYIKEDAIETKKTIYALLIITIITPVLLQTLNWYFNLISTQNPFKQLSSLFRINPWVIFIGTVTLFLDTLLIIFIFEYISKKTRFLFLRICLTMFVVISFDTVFFSILAFWNSENQNSIIISSLISKGTFTIFYSFLFYVYLRFIDSNEPLTQIFKIRDVFQPLTFKQKFEHAEEVLKENAEMYRIIGEHSNDLILLQEPDSTFKYISPSVKKILGYEQSEFIGEKVFSIVHKDDLKSIKDPLEQKLFITGNVTNPIPLRVRHKEGHYVWLEFLSSPVYKEEKLSYFVTTARDITQRVLVNKKSENSLKLLEKSENSLNEAGKVAKIGYQEYDIATDTYTWSDYAYDLYGLDRREKVPSIKQIISIFDDNSQKKIKKAALNLTSNGIPCDIELRGINLKKEEIWVRYVAKAVHNDQNEVIGRRGVLQNITASKKAQLELELSKQKIQTSLDLLEKSEYSKNEASKVAKIGYWDHDLLNNTVIWSEYVHHIFGSNPKQGIPAQEIIINTFNKESQQKLSQATVNLISNGTPYDLELKCINLNKEEIWVRNVAQPIYNEQNEIIGKRGILHNITDSKIAQLELDLQNEKLSELYNILNQAQKLSHIGSWQWHMKMDKAEWSDEMYNIYGVTKDNFYPSNKNVVKTVLAEDLNKFEKNISSLLNDEIFVPFEFRIKRPSGEIRNLYIIALERKSKDSVFGVTKDITEAKKIEEENYRIKENYRILFENATISIWNEDFTEVIKQIDTLRKLDIPNIKIYLDQHPEVLSSLLNKIKVNSVNKATLKLFKAKNYENFKDHIKNTFGKGALKVFGELIESIWNNDKGFTSEVNYKTLEGDEFAALFSIPIPQTAIEQKTVPVSIQCIQSIKIAEAEKKESINKFKEAQKLANLGSWIFNSLDQKSEWSEETFRIWGLNPKEGSPDFETILSQIHKDDLELHNSSVEKAIRLGVPFDIEFRIFHTNGKQKTLRGICEPVFGETGEVVSLKGTNQDITEQKLIRNKIDEAEKMYRILTDNSNDLICLHEIDSTFKYISPSIKNLLGYEQSELLGRNVFGIVHNDDIEDLKYVMEQRVSSGMFTEAFSCRVLHKEGHIIWLEFLSSPIYKGKEISSFVSSARDITQWVLAKKKIEEYQTSLQKLTTEITLIEEEQKKKIASNIHDHLSQSLVISKMKINELKKIPLLKVIDDDLKFIETHISEALENSRKITYELSPPVLYQLGIIEALNWLIDNVETTHKIECQLNSNVNHINLNDVKSILLYRSIQEVLTNTIKYANASLITLDINKGKLGLGIFITDNGVGFDTSKLNNQQNQSHNGFGLFTIQERIRNIQGKFEIKSKINVGTSINFFIPLSK
jgi:PAS domain S-box-containing protein